MLRLRADFRYGEGCGGACAAAAAARARGLVGDRVTVCVPGGELTVTLGATARLAGPVAAVFEARRVELAERLRGQLAGRTAPGAPLAERVRELAVIQDEAGYLARAAVDDEGTILLEHNCAILNVARGTAAACEAELALFRDLLDADVVRESHIVAGDRCCSYRITPRA